LRQQAGNLNEKTRSLARPILYRVRLPLRRKFGYRNGEFAIEQTPRGEKTELHVSA